METPGFATIFGTGDFNLLTKKSDLVPFCNISDESASPALTLNPRYTMAGTTQHHDHPCRDHQATGRVPQVGHDRRESHPRGTGHSRVFQVRFIV